jgi:pyruvate,water dikinase
MSDVLAFRAINPDATTQFGGKGVSLARLARAGLPVPPGFCLSTGLYARLVSAGVRSDSATWSAILAAYQELGGGLVAVRSSATAEDGATASLAGQQETVLGVQGEAALADAIVHCWASLHSERARAYRAQQGVTAGGMGVVVQRLIAAEVAGVLFTRDPLQPDAGRMIVEASFGLGESVVSGAVTPDRFVLNAADGRMVEQHLGRKTTRRDAAGTQPVTAEAQAQFCLSAEQLQALAALGRRVAEFEGGPRDLEWAWADGQIWLLQSRPITATAGTSERAAVRTEEIANARAQASSRGTVWVRHNLAEVLPEPTPMTWAIVTRFMSGRGGYGNMYRDLGYRPDLSLDEQGTFDLIAGRPYENLSRQPLMQLAGLGYEHPFAALKADPRQALAPTPVATFAGFGLRDWFDWLLRRIWRPGRALKRIAELSVGFADYFRQQVIPSFLDDLGRASSENLAALDVPTLRIRLETWNWRTVVDFARESLKPTVLADYALQQVQTALTPGLGAVGARQAVMELTAGSKPDADADVPTALHQRATGTLSAADFLTQFGHRGRQEMELSLPRWREQPAEVERLARAVGTAPATPPDVNGVWERIHTQAKLSAVQLAQVEPWRARLVRYLALREVGKHYLMRGYEHLRTLLLELDRRYELNGGIFYLTPDELPDRERPTDLADTIAARRQYRRHALSLEAPLVLFSDDLDAIGRPQPVPTGAATLTGVPVSAGVASGPALVLTEPDVSARPSEPYVLVCPTTDPAWVPLFVGAQAIVLETGGVLSHGAIVAREFGLPAVAGLPGILQRVRTGQRVHVDGTAGTVAVSEV